MADPTDLPGGIQSLLQQHAVNGAQRQADGAAHYAENLRYGFLTSQASVGAKAIQTLDESGSGRARIIDNTAQPTSSSKPA